MYDKINKLIIFYTSNKNKIDSPIINKHDKK